MLLNLKAQELMNRGECTLVGSHDNNPCAVRRFLEGVPNLFLQPLHLRDTMRHSVVHKHRNIKITILKSVGDVAKVHPNVVSVACVLCVVRLHLNHAAI